MTQAVSDVDEQYQAKSRVYERGKLFLHLTAISSRNASVR